MFELKGIIPPMVTPFDANGDIVYADFESNLDRYLEADADGQAAAAPARPTGRHRVGSKPVAWPRVLPAPRTSRA